VKPRVTEDSARVRLELTSRPESVTLVRSALAGLAEVMDFEPELLDDLKTAVSEACNNVVMHAYAGDVGPLAVTIATTPKGLDVLVEDQGGGIQHVSASEDRMGVGLAVISALADRAEFQSPHDGGTEVRMSFDRGGSGMQTLYGPGVAAGDGQAVALSGDVIVWLAPVSLLPTVLGRLCRAVAASSHFSLQRFADLYTVSDAIAGYADRATAGSPIGFSIAATPRRLELTGGPFLEDGGAGPLAADAQARRTALAGLVDELSFEAVDGYELLHLLFVEHRDGDQ
jgi:serine/threonine-protein kinase RsbW